MLAATRNRVANSGAIRRVRLERATRRDRHHQASRQIGLTLLPASPSIFVDPDGVPLVMNADTGLVLDPATPARSGARLQILATGLGQVRPEWPTGLAGPMENAPRVVTTGSRLSRARAC